MLRSRSYSYPMVHVAPSGCAKQRCAEQADPPGVAAGFACDDRHSVSTSVAASVRPQLYVRRRTSAGLVPRLLPSAADSADGRP